MGTRIAVSPAWVVTTDGLRHVVASKHISTDGVLVKAMCGHWLIPDAPSAHGDDCRSCAPHAPTP